MCTASFRTGYADVFRSFELHLASPLASAGLIAERKSAPPTQRMLDDFPRDDAETTRDLSLLAAETPLTDIDARAVGAWIMTYQCARPYQTPEGGC